MATVGPARERFPFRRGSDDEAAILEQAGLDVTPSRTEQASRRLSWAGMLEVAWSAIARIAILSALSSLSADLVADATPKKRHKASLDTEAFRAVVEIDDPDRLGGTGGVVQVYADGNSGDSSPEMRSGRLSPAFCFLTDVHVDDGKLVIHGGTEDSEVRLLAIHRLDTLERLDVIWGRNMVSSPSGRFAVFERFVPRVGLADASRFEALLHDARPVLAEDRAVEDPHAPSAIQVLFRGSDDGAHLARLTTPRGPGARADMSDWAVGPSFTWSHDERQVAFLLERPLEGETPRSTRLAVVSLDAFWRPQPAVLVDLDRVHEGPFMKIEFDGSSIRLEQRRGESGKLIRHVDWQ